MTRPGGSIAVLIGAIVGVTAALSRRGEESPPPLAPAASRPLETARREEPTPEATVALASAHATPVTTSEPALPSASAGAAASASPQRSPAPAPVASPAELQAIEVRCYAQDPPACRRAAAAYEAGVVVARDPERARTYRRVEVTQLVRQCEKNKVLACATLAELHATGDGVEQNARRAEQLNAHARELCRRRPSEDCRSLGPFSNSTLSIQ